MLIGIIKLYWVKKYTNLRKIDILNFKWCSEQVIYRSRQNKHFFAQETAVAIDFFNLKIHDVSYQSKPGFQCIIVTIIITIEILNSNLKNGKKKTPVSWF